MIADTAPSAPTAAAPELPLLKPGHSFKQNGREFIVVQPEGGGPVIWVEVVRSIDTALIDSHPRNRTWCDPVAQKELTDNMREHGQSTPGIVRPHPTAPGRYELIAGWRRTGACRELGRTFQAVVRELDDVQALEQLYLENAQRENLRPLDEAELIDGMLELRDDKDHRVFSLERVALARYGSAKPADMARISQIHKLKLLPEKLREPVNGGLLPLAVAFLVARIADPADREQAGAEVLQDPQSYSEKRPMTVKRARQHIASNYQVNLKGWKGVDQLDLLSEEEKIAMGFTGKPGEEADGSCERCPYLARNNALFQDALAVGRKAGTGESGLDPLTCTRAPCHRMKLNNEWKLKCAVLVRKHGLAPEDVLGLDVWNQQRWNHSELSERPAWNVRAPGVAEDDPKLPTWETILKGSKGIIKVAPNEKGEPVLVCLRSAAVAYGREHRPEWFSKEAAEEVRYTVSEVRDLKAARDAGELKAGDAEKLAAIEAKEESERLDQLTREMERAVERETKMDCLKELKGLLTEKGPGLAGGCAMVMAVCRELEDDFLAFLTGRPVEEFAETDWEEGQNILKRHLEGLGLNELLAVAAIAAVWDDVHFSGHQKAEDFGALCLGVGLDTKAIHKRVKKAHELAFKAREKARADELAGKVKKPAKNSTDPVRVDTAKEASKTAAADARASDDRVVLLEYSAVEDEAAMLQAMLTHEVPVTAPNEHGIFLQRAVFAFSLEESPAVRFAIDLVTTAGGEWAGGFDFRVGESSGEEGNLPSDELLYERRSRALSLALADLYKAWAAATPRKRMRNAWEITRALLARLLDGVKQVDDAAAEAARKRFAKQGPTSLHEKAAAGEFDPIGDASLFDSPTGGVLEAPVPAAAAVIDLDAVDVDAAAAAVMTQGEHYTDFIGPKPHKNNDRERFKKWDALRDKIQRRAGLK